MLSEDLKRLIERESKLRRRNADVIERLRRESEAYYRAKEIAITFSKHEQSQTLKGQQ